MKKKTDSDLAKAIFIAKKNNLKELASALSTSTRKQAKVNLDKLNKVKEEVVIVPGKVLSNGNLDKKIKIFALGFSEKAKEKLKKSGSEYGLIIDALEKNNKLKAKILK